MAWAMTDEVHVTDEVTWRDPLIPKGAVRQYGRLSWRQLDFFLAFGIGI